MAQAYSAFGNGGLRTKGYGIERIRTATGRVLYDHNLGLAPRTRVINQPALGEMIQIMRQVMISGTGVRARVPGRDVAGKTGTTSDYRDAWFVGYTGGFTAAVWTGRDDNTPMKRVTGGSSPADIWKMFMAASLPRLNVQGIPGGQAAPAATPTPGNDLIGDLLNGAGGDKSATTPQPKAPPPSIEDPPPG